MEPGVQGRDRTADEARVDRPRTVLVVDDHKTFADLLELALQRDPALDCVGVAYSIESALDRFDDLEPDIAVMDHRFAGSDLTGVDAAAVMIERRPDTQVVLLTAHANRGMLRDAARVGIASVLPKDGNLADLRAVLVVRPTGGLVVHPALLKSLVERTGADDRLPNLSAREAETLDLLTLGLDVRMIADQMGVSVNTCRAYVKSVLAKLHAHSQLEAVAIARRNGWTAEDGRR